MVKANNKLVGALENNDLYNSDEGDQKYEMDNDSYGFGG